MYTSDWLLLGVVPFLVSDLRWSDIFVINIIAVSFPNSRLMLLDYYI